jgi:streptogramin lyase
MEVSTMTTGSTKKQVVGRGVVHPGARPMQVFRDDDGCLWLCDKGIDPRKGFDQQGCWRCKDLAFTRND